MLKLTAAERIAKRTEQAEASNSPKKLARSSTEDKVTKSPKKPKRSFVTTKSKIIRQSHKKAEAIALKQATQTNVPMEQQLTLVSDAYFDDNDIDYGIDFDEQAPSSFTNTLPRQPRRRSNRKELWAKLSLDLKKWYLESFEIHGHADSTLKQPNALESIYQCDCNSRKTTEVYCYMLHSHLNVKIQHCDHVSIVKKLMLMQMLPSSTVIPKVAIHFSVFEKLMSLKLNGYISNYSFVKTQNADNLLLSYYGRGGFKPLNNGLFNTLQVIFRNLKSHALDDLRLFHQSLYCHACVGADRVGIVLDGNFQLKRKKNQRNHNDMHFLPSIFSESRDVRHLWEDEGEVEKFAIEKDDFKEEMCGLEELDNGAPSFKATAENRKVSNRFDEEGVFSMNCARHGVPIRLYDIFNGEGRKYALAAVSHIVSTLLESQKLLIMYDIICLCKKKLEACIPGLLDKDPTYLVTVFHAYAHSMHCQVMFHPKVVNGSGNTDGEGVERFWSTANKFIAMTRQMSKFNRKALLTDVVHHFRQTKMLELPAQISSKFDKALAKVTELNMTNEQYIQLEQQWNAHVEIVMIPATAVGVQMLIARAERSTTAARDSYYLKLNIELLMLNELKDANGNRIEITRGRNLQRKNFLTSQIEQLQTKYGYSAISSLEDRQFHQHRSEIIEVRYQTMNDFIKHLLFAILMKERKISQPGSFGTAKAAKIIISLDALKKKAEAIIAMINKFVEKSYNTEEDRRRRTKETVGKEVERIRKYAEENGMDLPSHLNNWHILKRNVEEIPLLIGEANRIIENYNSELYFLRQRPSSHFVQLRILDVTRRLRLAKVHLDCVLKNAAPALLLTRETDDLGEKVVVFSGEEATLHQAYAEEEGEADDDSGDEDLAEGGEPNPEEELLITFGDFAQDSTSNSK